MGRGVCKSSVARAAAALEADQTSIGARLGVFVYLCNVPSDAIADKLRVSLPTVYRWFFGTNDVDPPYRNKVIRLTAILELAYKNELLPAVGTKEARTQALTKAITDVVEKARAQA